MFRYGTDFTIPGVSKLLIALRFYAVGCFLQPLADLFGLSKSTACDVVAEVSYLIASKLRRQFLTMPTNHAEIQSAKIHFQRIANFPFVVGAVDGTFIRLQSMGGDTAELFRNRKQFFSINCQIAVSADVSTCKFLSI